MRPWPVVLEAREHGQEAVQRRGTGADGDVTGAGAPPLTDRARELFSLGKQRAGVLVDHGPDLGGQHAPALAVEQSDP